MKNVYWGVHGALAALTDRDASILLIGDSWFWYPIDNLATEIGGALPNETLVAIGHGGANAAAWSDEYRKDIDFGFKMFGSGVKALMLSGGGNDIAGMSDFLHLLKDDCSSAEVFAECFREGQPDAIISRIIAAYREVILRFRGYNKLAPVFVHNYDKAWPTGRGVFGPSDWLKAPMVKAKVPARFRRQLFIELLKRLNEAQLALKAEPAMGPVVVILSAGTMPDNPVGAERWWANELHPTPEGFHLIANKAFVPELAKIFLT